jgi:hypothetical protein
MPTSLQGWIGTALIFALALFVMVAQETNTGELLEQLDVLPRHVIYL